jgi:hypothetical protein
MRTLLATAALLAALSPAVADDSLTVLLRHQTDEGSNAGQRGDQATVNGFLDDRILFSGGDGSVDHDAKFDANDAVADLIKRQTMALRATSRAPRRLLGDRLQFVDESRVLFGKRNLHSALPGAAPAVYSNWLIHHTDDVAAASFTETAGGIDFLAVEIWHRAGTRWTLLGSKTIPLHRDPPTVVLPPDVLDAYAGTYTAGPGSVVLIARDGNGLTSSANGGKPAPMIAEATDLFFTPGQPPGYARPHAVFQRDTQGTVTGYVRNGISLRKVAGAGPTGAGPVPGPLKLRDFIVRRTGDVAVASFFHDRDTPYYGQTLHQTYRSMETWVRHGGAWKMIASQGDQVLSDPPIANLPSDVLNGYVGTYTADGERVTIARRGDGLVLSSPTAKRAPLEAEARDVLFVPGAPLAYLLVQRDASGHVTGFIRRRYGSDVPFARSGA